MSDIAVGLSKGLFICVCVCVLHVIVIDTDNKERFSCTRAKILVFLRFFNVLNSNNKKRIENNNETWGTQAVKFVFFNITQLILGLKKNGFTVMQDTQFLAQIFAFYII